MARAVERRRRYGSVIRRGTYKPLPWTTWGGFLCNTLQEAFDSTAQTVAGRTRDFDLIVIGGGTFWRVVAEHLLVTDRTRSRRILVLEAGPFVLPEHVQNMPFMGGSPDLRVPVGESPAPHYSGLIFAIGGARRSGDPPMNGIFLHVLRQHETARLRARGCAAARAVGDEKMFRDDGAKGTPADDDQVEVAPSSGDSLRGAIERFLQRVAEEPPHVVQGKGCRFRA